MPTLAFWQYRHLLHLKYKLYNDHFLAHLLVTFSHHSPHSIYPRMVDQLNLRRSSRMLVQKLMQHRYLDESVSIRPHAPLQYQYSVDQSKSFLHWNAVLLVQYSKLIHLHSYAFHLGYYRITRLIWYFRYPPFHCLEPNHHHMYNPSPQQFAQYYNHHNDLNTHQYSS